MAGPDILNQAGQNEDYRIIKHGNGVEPLNCLSKAWIPIAMAL
jgi:hypothetical protein